MKKICLILFLLCSSISYAHVEWLEPQPQYISAEVIYQTSSKDENKFDFSSDCPMNKPFFKKTMGYIYPEIISLADAIELKYINLTVLQPLLELRSDKALIFCNPQDDECFKKREAIETEVEKEIGQENEIISRQNEEIDSKRNDIRKRIKEIKEYNKNIKTERDYFQRYRHIFSKISEEDKYMRMEHLFPFVLEPVEYSYSHHHSKPASDDYSKIRETNEEIQKKNLEIEKENQEIEKINQHRHQQNELILKILKSTFSTEYLDGIEKEYEQMLKDRCFSCSDLPTSIILSKDECKRCSDRKFISDEGGYYGTCQLIDKKEE